MLDERKTAILRAVVEEYVTTAQPVGSTHISNAPGVQVSSATVRHDMAVLEQEGFLVQPHTSAGRIPTDKGYRFFVDHLAPNGPLCMAGFSFGAFVTTHAFDKLCTTRQIDKLVLVGTSVSRSAAAPIDAAAHFKTIVIHGEADDTVDVKIEGSASVPTVLNAGVSIPLGSHLHVLARGTNLADRQYEETLGYPALRRSLIVGVRVAQSR